MYVKPSSALMATLSCFSIPAVGQPLTDPTPTIVVETNNMPQRAPKKQLNEKKPQTIVDSAIALYYQLKNDYSVSTNAKHY